MRILISNYTLESRSGTETFVRDLALALLARGHSPVVYSPRLGPIAEELRLATVPVVEDLGALREPPDVIHGQHIHETITALLRFPQVPGIFVMHDWHSWHDTPPRLPQIRRYVAVDQTRRDRLVCEHGISPDLVQVIPNAVDTSLFRPRSVLPEKPRRALLFSNYVDHPGHLRQLSEACGFHGIDLQVVGSGMGNTAAQPHLLLPDFDLVFGLGRSAMEAMATGTGVIIWGLEGLGGFVRRSNFDQLLSRNFGRRGLVQTDSRAIAGEIAAFSREEAEWVRDRIRGSHNLDWLVTGYLEVYGDVVREASERPVPMVSTLEAAGQYLAQCVPKVQVDSLLREKVTRGAKRIKKLADLVVVLTALGLILLDAGLFPLLGARHLWLSAGLIAATCSLLGWAYYLRSWLRARSTAMARAGWARRLRLE